MEIKIRKLEPDLLEDYLFFCENTAHSDYPDFARCYCVSFYSESLSLKNIIEDFTDPEVRRKYAIKMINEGNLQGYLAFDGTRVVGWCNSNDRADCISCWGLNEYRRDIVLDMKAKSVFCFAIDPNMRGKDIATALLKRICDDAIKEGYDCIEAYPEKAGDNMYYNFRGPIGLYDKLGFSIYKDMGNRLIVRKMLK